VKIRIAATLMLLVQCGTPALAEEMTFDDLYSGVTQCRFDLSRYADVPLDPLSDAVLIALPNAGAVRGFVITTFYFSPGRAGRAEAYGLVFNAPFDVVAKAFPELLPRETVNGHLRRLLRLSEETNDRKAARQTLLVCNSGTPT
jgi:hypothetical protein